MERQFLKLAVLFALAHCLVMLGLDAALYFLAHLPTSVLHLDSLIVALTHIHQWLRAPRAAMSHLWPGEYLPRFVNLALTVLNSVIWGIGLAALKLLWSKIRE